MSETAFVQAEREANRCSRSGPTPTSDPLKHLDGVVSPVVSRITGLNPGDRLDDPTERESERQTRGFSLGILGSHQGPKTELISRARIAMACHSFPILGRMGLFS